MESICIKACTSSIQILCHYVQLIQMCHLDMFHRAQLEWKASQSWEQADRGEQSKHTVSLCRRGDHGGPTGRPCLLL